MTMPREPRRPIPSRVHCLAACTALLLAACSHSDPFTPRDSSLTEPLVAGLPIRLTYNPGANVMPAWLPDGTRIIYAFGNPESRQQNDQCLGLLGRGGGSQIQRICNDSPFAGDSTDTFSWPTVSAGGRLAYVRGSKPVAARNDLTNRLVYGSLTDPRSFTTVRTSPFQGGNGAFYVGVADPAWLAEDRLAFLGLTDTSVLPCPGQIGCQFISIRSGRDILIADLSGDGITMTPVSGSAWATSVAAAPGEDQIYFTLAGSSRILQKRVPDGAASTVYDFGVTGIARDVHAASGQLVAIVGGLVQVFDENGNPIQQDSGGRLFVVDLASGTASELPKPATIFRNPALAPDGSSVVAEAYHLTITSRVVIEGTPPVVDTLVTGTPELWEFPLR
jgi:hypothetical protein